MKRFILLLVMLANAVFGFAQSDFFYSSKGEKELFKIRKDRVILKPKSETGAQKIIQRKDISSAYKFDKGLVIATIDTLKTRMDALIQNDDVADATYFLEYSDGTLQAPTDNIFVKPQEAQSLDKLFSKIGFSKNIVSTELINPQQGIYLITLNVKLGDVLSISRKLYETDLFEFVEPSFVRQLKPHNANYANQWGLKNTGQYGGTPGVDINAEAAWNITRGNNIKVAVIDEGVDLTHPDLQANLLPGYDATVSAPGGSNGSPYGNNAHGTACAGIIGAINNTIGIVGVASSAKIIPVRIAYDLYGYWTTNDLQIANGIQYAWETAQADILSNSWAHSGSDATAIDAQITNAVTYGRSGKGCVVVFSSGNNNTSSIGRLASLPNVIAVGAISPCGQRKSPSSCDSETTWGSNYGTALDVVAPGVLIPTTDIQGNAGYNPNRPMHTNSGGNKITSDYTNKDYTVWFNGTSAACPFVAGVAALILSVSPNLEYTQVKDIIEQTAQKTGGYNYQNESGRPNGTWNNQVGYGLVDAAAYVTSLSSCPSVTSIANAEISGGRTRLTASPANLSLLYDYVWQVSPSAQMVSQDRNVATFIFNQNVNYNISCYIRHHYNNNLTSSPCYTGYFRGDKYYVASPTSHQVTVTLGNNAAPQFAPFASPSALGVAASNISYSLINQTTGATVATGQMPAAGGTLNFSAIPNGIYVLLLETSPGVTESHKIILQ